MPAESTYPALRRNRSPSYWRKKWLGYSTPFRLTSLADCETAPSSSCSSRVACESASYVASIATSSTWIGENSPSGVRVVKTALSSSVNRLLIRSSNICRLGQTDSSHSFSIILATSSRAMASTSAKLAV